MVDGSLWALHQIVTITVSTIATKVTRIPLVAGPLLQPGVSLDHSVRVPEVGCKGDLPDNRKFLRLPGLLRRNAFRTSHLGWPHRFCDTHVLTCVGGGPRDSTHRPRHRVRLFAPILAASYLTQRCSRMDLSCCATPRRRRLILDSTGNLPFPALHLFIQLRSFNCCNRSIWPRSSPGIIRSLQAVPSTRCK